MVREWPEGVPETEITARRDRSYSDWTESAAVKGKECPSQRGPSCMIL